MGEISIDPKFNIHETYKKVRILNPYRNDSPIGGIDPDAANYLAAVGIINDTTVYYAGTPQEITGAAIYTAMNTFVGALKSEGVYDKLKAVYPLIGGNAGNHKWNLINPQDTNAAHRMLWYGAGTHSKTGFKGDGSTAYGDTNFNQSIHSQLNNESFGYYSRTDLNGFIIEMGMYTSSSSSYILARLNGRFYSRHQATSESGNLLVSTSLGFFGVTRRESSFYRQFMNNNYLIKNDVSISLSNINFYIGARNFSGSGNAFSNRELSYSFIGEGLTEIQMTAHYNAVQQLQTDLKRAV